MNRSAVLLRRAFVSGSSVWAAALPLATLAASRPDPAVPLYLFALVVYGIGSVVCHQMDDRSFHLWGRQLPVCARCTGIYFGAAVAAVLAMSARRSTRRLALRPTTAVAIAALPTVATLGFEWTTGITPSNGIRAAAGVVIGAAVASLVVYDVN